MFRMKSKFQAAIILVSVLMALTHFAHAQTQYKALNDSKITVNGTSTLHDWSMEAGTFDCTVSIIENTTDFKNIDEATFFLQVENLKSDKDGLNKRAYKSLKTKDISFFSTFFEIAQISSEKASGSITGMLTIAGITKEISFPFEARLLNENKIECDAIYKINMTDYGIDPPTFMLGTLKTGQEVDIKMHLIFEKE
jgi:polyisoprenoid-binding protein YceI